MKRVICTLLAILILTAALPVASAQSDQSNATFTVEQAEGKKGDLVTLDVTLSEAQSGIGALTIILQYDTEKLKLTTHPQSTNGTWMVPGEVMNDCNALWFAGDDRFAAIAADGFFLSGVVFSVAFEVLTEIPDDAIASVSVLVDTICHYENRNHGYAVSVVDGGVISIDKSAAKAVDAMIERLDVQSLEEEAAVIAAREAYNALDHEQKGYVTKLAKLEEAEAKIKELKQIAADQKPPKKWLL